YDTFMKETFRNFRILLQFNKKPGFKKCAETLQRYYPVNAMYDYSPSLVWYSDSGEMVNKFTSLNVSSCFIHGSENNRLSYIPELKQKGIPVFEISDSNHFPQYDNPEEYYRILAGFVDSLQ
ncbi:MAG: hypothetical protein JXB49_21540, partial [Bacteroidales bacterium]|nr:hypothetical protein [Bacteroidales bacterium]